ncbi:unnamed protein product [Penicillium salamii]|nr:unnamed protein product [Penicillium salamii]CAG8288710.1 unnamed protein product [Penicillium salamii]
MEENDEHYYIGTKEENLLLGWTGSKPGMVSPMVNEFCKVSKRDSFLANLY